MTTSIFSLKNALLLALGMLLNQAAFGATENFFIEITDDKVIVGEYVGENFKEKAILEFDQSAIDIAQIRQLLIADDASRNLFYIHSMWGGVQAYHRHSLRQLNTIPTVDRMISIVWHTEGFPYTGNWPRAINPGQTLASLMQNLWSAPDQTNFLLCHSMGHRVLEGIMTTIDPEGVQIEAAILAAADLHMDTFAERLQTLFDVSGQVHVYVNERDKWLKRSAIWHRQDRVGYAAAKRVGELQSIANIEVIDLSDSRANGKASRRSHIYFKRHTGVKRDIGLIIAGNLESRQQYLRQENDNFVKML